MISPQSSTATTANSTSSNGRFCSQYDNKCYPRKLPHWVMANIRKWKGERFCMPEWDHDESDDDEAGAENSGNSGVDRAKIIEYRSRNGWKGTDLCHSARHSPVRISHYTVKYSNKHHNNQRGGVGTILTGLCHCTQQSESHAGYCHGGSMTAAMDDVIGWTAFNVLGTCEPWIGHTVQVNVTLKRPILVGSYLKIVGEITKFEGRKVYVHAMLLSEKKNEEDDEVLHCDAEGLVILKKDVLASFPT